jgi:N-acetylmuramoyl-L-alanine amidase
MRKITGIIVHCTATRADWWAGKSLAKKIAEVTRWHVVDRGWSDCGYHYLIDRDGKVGTARPVERDGAHVRGYNKGTIGVSLFGGHGSSETDAFADNFTPQQDAALRRLIGNLRADYGPVPVTGHNEYAAKACPGFTVAPWLAAVSTPVPTPPAPVHWLVALLQSLFRGRS